MFELIAILNQSQVAKSWPGGSEKFLSLIWTSHISSYLKLKPHLRIRVPPASTPRPLVANEEVNFQDLVTDFLQGAGIPCPQLFADAKVHFSHLVDLSQINDGGFRARMFCWAATGSYERELDAPQILVSFT